MTLLLLSFVVILILVVAVAAFTDQALTKRWPWSWKWHLVPALRKSSFRSFGGAISSDCSSFPDGGYGSSELNEHDLRQLMSHINETDGGPQWLLMMKSSTPTLEYQAWYRDPQTGPTQYRTRTVFHNIETDVLRDFFWDDEYRKQWDGMLIYFKTLQIYPQTGTMIVHWIRKLPLISSEREYVMIRRIWEHESTYYCLAKGTEDPSLPRQKNRKRVENYYSSWRIRAVDSEVGRTASEVLLFHQEDLGMPKELVKVAVRAGMWGLVKKLDAKAQAYSLARAKGTPPSSYATLSRMTTKVSSSMMAFPHQEVSVQNYHHQRESKLLKLMVIAGIFTACGIKLLLTKQKHSPTQH
ncbi:hypothetical protein SLE2022_212980 [Rubroshorea leprosula]